MKGPVMMLACLLACLTLFSGCTGNGGGQDAGSHNAVESGVPDRGDDPGEPTGPNGLPDGISYEFEDPDHAGGMIVIPSE